MQSLLYLGRGFSEDGGRQVVVRMVVCEEQETFSVVKCVISVVQVWVGNVVVWRSVGKQWHIDHKLWICVEKWKEISVFRKKSVYLVCDKWPGWIERGMKYWGAKLLWEMKSFIWWIERFWSFFRHVDSMGEFRLNKRVCKLCMKGRNDRNRPYAICLDVVKNVCDKRLLELRDAKMKCLGRKQRRYFWKCELFFDCIKYKKKIIFCAWLCKGRLLNADSA